MFTVTSLASSSTAARLRSLLPTRPAVNAQCVEQPRLGLLVVSFGGFTEAAKVSAGSRPVGRITEQPVLAVDNKGPDGPLSSVVI